MSAPGEPPFGCWHVRVFRAAQAIHPASLSGCVSGGLAAHGIGERKSGFGFSRQFERYNDMSGVGCRPEAVSARSKRRF
jgi:hypothetical protein